MTFSEECALDLEEMLAEFGITVAFNGQTAHGVSSPTASRKQMEGSGYLPMLEDQVTLLESDFARLAISLQDEITVDGKTVRVTGFITKSPSVTLELKAIR